MESCIAYFAFSSLCFLLSSPIFACGSSPDGNTVTGTVYVNGSELILKLGVVDKKGAAYGTFEQAVNQTGWGVLNLGVSAEESGVHSDMLLMKAAGYLEGALTQELIYYNYLNIYDSFFDNVKPEKLEKVKDWYNGQLKWTEEMCATKSQSDSIWYYADLLLGQLSGLQEGYNKVAPKGQSLDWFALVFLNGNGDYLDLRNVIDPSQMPDFDKMSKDELTQWISMNGHCSALIKLLPGYENLLASHSTWFIYAAMLRIYKHYSFSLNDKRYASQKSSFSSYPGVLSSWDDFYLMDSKLMMLQTTNDVFNKELYSKVTKKGLLAWQRVRIANWLASSGRQWCEIIQQYNTGTYNNQYMVVDLKKVHLNNVLEDDALWVAEQIPGYVHIGDQTAILREGYWASYNVPFYEDVFNISGYPQMEKTMGTQVTHDLAPRAEIFRRDGGKVIDMASLQHLMRYNDYQHDPYSKGNPMNTICSRSDLKKHPTYFGGCTDTKVTSYEMALQLATLAINGPTYQDQPTFDWRNFPNVTAPHYGQPVVFNFPFVTMSPSDVLQ